MQLQQEHVLRLETRPSNIEGKGRVNATDLVRNALRMRPDRIIIGECRGPEALDMLQAMNTGHEGSLTTIHANAPRDAVSRLETMISMGGIDIPLKALRHQFASAVDLIIQANRLQGGPRKVTHITEVLNMEQDTVIMQDIFLFVQDGIDEIGPRLRALYGDRRSPGLHAALGIGRRPAAGQPVRRPQARTVTHRGNRQSLTRNLNSPGAGRVTGHRGREVIRPQGPGRQTTGHRGRPTTRQRNRRHESDDYLPCRVLRRDDAHRGRRRRWPASSTRPRRKTAWPS